MANVCEKGRQRERALQLFETMQQEGLEPNVFTYSALAGVCGNGQHSGRVLQRFETMQQQGFEPDVITYSALICAGEKVRRSRSRSGRCSVSRRWSGKDAAALRDDGAAGT